MLAHGAGRIVAEAPVALKGRFSALSSVPRERVAPRLLWRSAAAPLQGVPGQRRRGIASAECARPRAQQCRNASEPQWNRTHRNNQCSLRPRTGNATSFSSLAPFTLASGSRPAPTERFVQPGSGAADLNPVRGAMFIVTDGTTRGFLFFSGAADGPKAAVRSGRWGRLDVQSSAARRAAEKQERCG